MEPETDASLRERMRSAWGQSDNLPFPEYAELAIGADLDELAAIMGIKRGMAPEEFRRLGEKIDAALGIKSVAHAAPFTPTANLPEICEAISRMMDGATVTYREIGPMDYVLHVAAKTPLECTLRNLHDLLDNIKARMPVGLSLALQFADEWVALGVPAVTPAISDFMTSWLAHQSTESAARTAPRYAGPAWPPPQQQRTGLQLGP